MADVEDAIKKQKEAELLQEQTPVGAIKQQINPVVWNAFNALFDKIKSNYESGLKHYGLTREEMLKPDINDPRMQSYFRDYAMGATGGVSTKGNNLIQKAVDFFGKTINPKHGGYLLPDGEMLDFSGKKFGGGGSGMREMDHSEISNILEGTGNFYKSNNINRPHEVFGKQTGSIRMGYSPQDDKMVLQLFGKPTKQQIDYLKNLLTDNTYIDLELFNTKSRSVVNHIATDINPIAEFNKFMNKIGE